MSRAHTTLERSMSAELSAPLDNRVVSRRVAHKNELPTRPCFQLGKNLCARESPGSCSEPGVAREDLPG